MSKSLFVIAILIGCFTVPTVGQVPSPNRSNRSKESLAKVLSAASKSGRFEAAAVDELRAVESLFQRTILQLGDLKETSDDASQLADQISEWRSKQMELRKVELTIGSNANDSKLSCWILQEAEDAKRGRGIYVFCPRAQLRDVAIQAPHSFFDKHTRAINVRMLETGHFAAAAWNTVRRSEVDLAHHRFHYLNAFTTAWASVHPQASVIQLHGFANDKRNTAAGRTADLIISDGTRHPGTAARRLATSMHSGLAATELAELAESTQLPESPESESFKVKLYPFDCDELGATSNTQGKLLRSAGHSGFLHLEMSPRLRDELRRDANTLASFVNSILAIHLQR